MDTVYKVDRDKPKRRIYAVDSLRGIAIIYMVIYHIFFTLSFVVPTGFDRCYYDFLTPVEPLFAGMFIVIAGISSQLSHSNLKRGAILLAISIGISLVTYFVVPDEFILFGVLHCLSICMLIYAFLGKYIDKINPLLAIVIFVALAVLTWGLLQPTDKIYIGIDGLFKYQIPQNVKSIDFLWMFGIRNNSFSSGDYFPLFPWIFVFLTGTVIGRYGKKELFPKFTYNNTFPPLAFLGRHSLIIYIIHQPIIFAIATLINRI